MNTTAAPPAIAGATVRPLSPIEAAEAWQWASGDQSGDGPAWVPRGLDWLHATFDDGVLWGAYRTRCWVTGHGYGPLVVDRRLEALWEIRLFGPEAEILLWPDDEIDRGQLAGRLVTVDPAIVGHALRPIADQRVLAGNRVVPHSANGQGFTLVAEPTGARQVVPVDCAPADFDDGRRWPLRLNLVHHLEVDDATGAVRIALTRMTDVVLVTGDDNGG